MKGKIRLLYKKRTSENIYLGTVHSDDIDYSIQLFKNMKDNDIGICFNDKEFPKAGEIFMNRAAYISHIYCDVMGEDNISFTVIVN